MKTPHSPPSLSLTVQYATDAPELTRSRLRRWVNRALTGGWTDLVARRQAVPKAADMTLRLVGTEEGATLNENWRHGRGATNVLTFAYGINPDGVLQADIVLCMPVIQAEAQQQNKPLRHHAEHLVIHGILHALGYEHDTDAQAQVMEELERELLGSTGIPDPYQAISSSVHP